MAEVDDNFLLWVIIILGAVLLLHFLFGKMMRRILGVEKRKAFSYNHINKRHAVGDWIIRIGMFIITMVALTMYHFAELDYRILILSIVLIPLAPELYRAYMEKKYQGETNNYKYTLAEVMFISFLVVLIFGTNFFGLINIIL